MIGVNLSDSLTIGLWVDEIFASASALIHWSSHASTNPWDTAGIIRLHVEHIMLLYQLEQKRLEGFFHY